MIDGPYRGEVALVTGANKGIGLRIARRLGEVGMTVHLGARDQERGRAAERELRADGLDARFTRIDVTVQEQVEAAAERIGAEHGRLDVLVNNAGVVVEWGIPTAEITAEHMRAAFEVNVFGTVAVTNAFIPLLSRSANARVVNISSPLGSLSLLSDPENPISTRGLLPYSSSKAALNAVTLVYANALRGEGIKVNAANPGLVATDLNSRSPFSRGVLTPEQGAEVPVRLALLPEDGPTGSFRGSGDGDGSVDVVVPW
ncbi:SDR family oxidoreductase [Actinokineospora spheciospongiae]|uniref:SDR family oxidoreductase n=1 Tax=Actinokineospora spheciospongiae TaxID=909613 RepID=UPI000D71CD55|nr:SDR family oxidoreductase [Actinokineospora spheciospongiae]PWW63199.1 NAD(P)-dependent dehydrogenase (short-subunit alcohol dehydrogenase family) [Actinokineospora spheciospongiae]